MKKITRRSFLAVCGAAAAAAALTACGGSASSASTTAFSVASAASSTAEKAAGTLSGNVATGGSTSMKNVIAALTEGFAEVEPGVTVSYDPTGSGTRDGFESIVDVKDSCKYAQELTATGAVISAVEANPLAIGYASLSAVGDTVAMVTVEGVECSEDTVKDGSYKIQRPFVFVTNKSVALSEQAQAFVDFATSKDAADLIRTAGAVPVNE